MNEGHWTPNTLFLSYVVRGNNVFGLLAIHIMASRRHSTISISPTVMIPEYVRALSNNAISVEVHRKLNYASKTSTKYQ